MKINYPWLQTYFEEKLPPPTELAEALTFHAFEIESVDGDVLDVKVTPNRGHDALSHRGIAKELSAILNIPLKHDPLRESVSLLPQTDAVAVSLPETGLCGRYIAGYLRGVKVGPSPQWLKERIESIGQRSINNVVDAANFVMFDLGEPLHAFDAGKFTKKGNQITVGVRNAKQSERITTLEGKEYELTTAHLVITDDGSDTPIAIAGVKGGKLLEVTPGTTELILEAAAFDGVSVRRGAAALKLRTEASSRFEQVLSKELPLYAMNAFAKLVLEVAGGEVVGFVDAYPEPQTVAPVTVSVSQINGLLGTHFSPKDVEGVFTRLDLPYIAKGETFTVHPPHERLDLTIPEDLVEEVGRIKGYENVPASNLPAASRQPEVSRVFALEDAIRENFLGRGYTEVLTSVFTEKGERAVLNKVDSVKPYLRESLLPGLTYALEKNVPNKGLLGLTSIKLFEIGTVWRNGKEETLVGTADEKSATEQSLEEAGKLLDVSVYKNYPLSTTVAYQPFSQYPAVLRDVSLFVPSGVSATDVEQVIRGVGTDLLVKVENFDVFEKGNQTSYALHLVFQADDRTLTDSEVSTIMENVTRALEGREGWKVR
ncbi:MAG: phenylalanine--tRNA ligase subunit beta [Parcubacteria group bacterium]|nr:phenylalanine--tRNA ligase subunit beta [Parcubacteria group bacterium]